MTARAGPDGRPSRWPVAVAWLAWLLSLLALAATFWLDRRLDRASLPDLSIIFAANVPLIVVTPVVAATVGAVIASRRPRHPVGWLLLLGVGLSVTLFAFTFSYTRYGLVGSPGSLPGASYLAGPVNSLVLVWLSCAAFILLLTPSGKLPSPRWRWWARIAATATAVWVLGSAVSPQPLYPEYPDIGNPLAVAPLVYLDAAVLPAGIVVLISLVVGAVSLITRFRRSRGVERQQLRWLAFGSALAAVALVLAIVALVIGGNSPTFEALVGICGALLPLATGAAVLQYRLYDLDRIISRALAYALLTVLLASCYAGAVLGLGQLFGGLGDEPPSWAVAGATLALAAAFQPARHRIQGLVDRRFNRRRYDAARTIQGFSARLRQQVDLDTLSRELFAVVDQTMQPTGVSLWLRPTALQPAAASDAPTPTGSRQAGGPPAPTDDQP